MHAASPSARWRATRLGVMFLCGAIGCGARPGETPAEHDLETRPAECTPSFETQSSAGVRYEDITSDDTSAWPVDGVTFTTVATREGSGARVVGTLRNDGDEERTVDFLTGGVPGIASNPFDVTIEGAPPRVGVGPEVYPEPRRAILPAGATTTFSALACPAAFPARIAWSFQPWSGGPVGGALLVR